MEDTQPKALALPGTGQLRPQYKYEYTYVVDGAHSVTCNQTRGEFAIRGSTCLFGTCLEVRQREAMKRVPFPTNNLPPALYCSRSGGRQLGRLTCRSGRPWPGCGTWWWCNFQRGRRWWRLTSGWSQWRGMGHTCLRIQEININSTS